MMTPAQSRAARGLLGWTQAELASAATIGVVTVRQFEGGNAEPRPATLTVLRQALEVAGVEFVPEDRRGVGVRMRFPAVLERLVAELLALHASADDLARVDEVTMGCSEEERGALARAVGDRLWIPGNKPTDERGREIQDRLVRVGRFA